MDPEITTIEPLVLSKETKASILRLVIVSLIIKIGAFIWKYYEAFGKGNFRVGNPDEWGYLKGAVLHGFEIKVGSHWFYDWLNWMIQSFTGNVKATYTVLCFINTVLSLLLPLLFLPVLRSFSGSSEKYERLSLWYCGVLLLWPTAIWYSVSNMKDMLLATLTCSYLSLVLSISESNELGKNILRWLMAIAALSLVFTNRVYLAGFLGASTAAFFLMSQGKKLQKLFMVGILALTFVFSGAFGVALEFLDPQKNFLMNEDAGEAKSQKALAQKGSGVGINYTPVPILVSAVRFAITPVPKLTPQDMLETILIVQTAIGLFCLFPLWRGVRLLSQHHSRFLFFTQIGFVFLFYGVAEVFAGPRQRFATLDILSIFLVCLGLAQDPDRGERGRFERGLGVVVGISLNFISMVLYAGKDF